MRASLLLFGIAALAASAEEASEELALLQTQLHTQVHAHPPPQAETNWTDHVMQQMSEQWTNGAWAFDPPHEPGCGRSTFQELQVTIPIWQYRNPGVNGFCHFQNHAMWFLGADSDEYRAYGKRFALHMGRRTELCDSMGEAGKGPQVEFGFDAGEISWTHMRSCVDVVDDPYCYSLGWLKGQGGWEESLMDNKTAWQQLAREQCDKLQAEFHFDDEEVTVGRHVFTTPLYFKRTWNSLQSSGMPIDKRLHAEHVYTKCMLGGGGAPIEMAYCFYKGCVLPGGKIGHVDECNYDP